MCNMMYDVVVLGAGVVGLSTAVNIQQCLPECQLTIIADKFEQDTTSHGAAGSFRVTLEPTTNEYEARYRKWSQDSFDWYQKLEQDYDPTITGVLRMSGYQVNTTKRQYPYHRQFMYNFRDLTETELRSIPGNYRFLSHGGRIEKRQVRDLSEFAGRCRVLVNCAGNNSGHFVQDKLVYPVRGHVIRVKAPWVRHFYIINNGETYIYPGQDSVVLGGTRHKGEHDLDLADHWFTDIKTRCTKLLPGLKGAAEIQRWAGLRPSRTEIRLEPELLQTNGIQLQIVHNYGHGGNGIALSWGTGKEAADIVRDLVSNVKSRL